MNRKKLAGVILATALPVSFWLVLASGEVAISPSEIFAILAERLSGDGSQGVRSAILWDVRIPRALTAFATGAALAFSGVIFQGLLLNPLAEPYTLGVATGAALGASIAITFQLPGITIFAFAGSLLTLILVWGLGKSSSGTIDPTRLILAGVIISSILGSGITLLKVLAGQQVAVIVLWLLGSFTMASWSHVALSAAAGLAVLLLGLFFWRDLDVIASGASPASLGVDEDRVRIILLLACSLATSVVVSMSGVIGFVGLVAPHLLRLTVGPGHGHLLPLSWLGGGLLLLMADAGARSLGELPVGVITALIGGPLFCWLLWRGR